MLVTHFFLVYSIGMFLIHSQTDFPLIQKNILTERNSFAMEIYENT